MGGEDVGDYVHHHHPGAQEVKNADWFAELAHADLTLLVLSGAQTGLRTRLRTRLRTSHKEQTQSFQHCTGGSSGALKHYYFGMADFVEA